MTERGSEPKVDWGVGHYERTAQMLLPAAQVLVDAAGLSRDERVVDVGCGTGNVALLAAAAGARVTAVDPSPRLLEVTRAAAEQDGLDIEGKTGEAEALPLTDHSFDCVLSNFGVIFTADPDRAVAELARVVASTGRVLFTAWLPGSAMNELAGAAQDLVRDAVGAPPAPPGFKWHEAADVQALFSRYGLDAAQLSRSELAFTAASPQAYLDAEVASHPLALMGFKVLEQRGGAQAAQERLLRILVERNEDPDAFRSTSQYVVVAARRTGVAQS